VVTGWYAMLIRESTYRAFQIKREQLYAKLYEKKYLLLGLLKYAELMPKFNVDKIFS
jgi:hypothetical protein